MSEAKLCLRAHAWLLSSLRVFVSQTLPLFSQSLLTPPDLPFSLSLSIIPRGGAENDDQLFFLYNPVDGAPGGFSLAYAMTSHTMCPANVLALTMRVVCVHCSSVNSGLGGKAQPCPAQRGGHPCVA